MNEETKINVEEELKKLSKEAERITPTSDFGEFLEHLNHLLNSINNKEKYEELINDVVVKLIYNDRIRFWRLEKFYEILKDNNIEKKYEGVITIRLAKKFIKNILKDEPLFGEDKETIIEDFLRELMDSNRELLKKVAKASASMMICDVINTLHKWMRNPNSNQEVSCFIMFAKGLKRVGVLEYIRDEIELFKNALKLYDHKIEKLIKRRMKNENLKRETASLIEIIEDARFFKYLL